MSTSTLKALVAEDEPAMLSLMARHMKTLGFNVIEAPNGDKAWELAEEHHPDLVVLDVMMPGMSGWEVCKRIKSDASEGHPLARTGVIMLTGIGENLNELTSPLFAADAWLNKPFEFAELDVKVQETLARYGKSMPSRYGKGAIERALEAPAKESKMRNDDEHSDGGEDQAGKESSGRSRKSARKGDSSKRSAKSAPAKEKSKSSGGSKKASRPAAKSVKKPAAKSAKKPAAGSAKKPAAKKAAAKPAAKSAKKPAAGSAKKPAAKKAAAKPAAKKSASAPKKSSSSKSAAKPSRPSASKAKPSRAAAAKKTTKRAAPKRTSGAASPAKRSAPSKSAKPASAKKRTAKR